MIWLDRFNPGGSIFGKERQPLMQHIGREIRELDADVVVAERRWERFLRLQSVTVMLMIWAVTRSSSGLPLFPEWLVLEKHLVLFFGLAVPSAIGISGVYVAINLARSLRTRDELRKKKEDLLEETLKACDAWD